MDQLAMAFAAVAIAGVAGCSDSPNAGERVATVYVVANGVVSEIPRRKVGDDSLGDSDKREGVDFWEGVQEAFQSLNGKSSKLQIKPAGLDDAGLPEEAAARAEFIVKDPLALAVAGHLSSAAALDAFQVYSIANIPVILPSASADCLSRSRLSQVCGGAVDNTFRLIPSDMECQAPVIADHVRSLGGADSAVAVVYDLQASVKTYAEPLALRAADFIRSMQQQRNGQIIVWGLDSSDSVRRQEAAIRTIGSRLIVYVGYATGFQLFGDSLSAAHANGATRPIVIASDGCMSLGLRLPNFTVHIACPLALPEESVQGADGAQHKQVNSELLRVLGDRNLVDFAYGYDSMAIVFQACRELIDENQDVTHGAITRHLNARGGSGRQPIHGFCQSYEFHDGENAEPSYYLYEFIGPGRTVSFGRLPIAKYNASAMKKILQEFAPAITK